MNVGIAVWGERVSPLLDTCRELLIVDVEGGKEVSRRRAEFGEYLLPLRVRRLAELGLDVLICGAVSRVLLAMISCCGIRLIGWTSGDVEEVLRAFLSGGLNGKQFVMPGCPGRLGRRFGRGARWLRHR